MAFEIVDGVLKRYTKEDGVTEVVIPDDVTSIGKYAFYKCASLTRITIPESVTDIGEGAFASCRSLTQITIPDSVTSIGWQAFCYCSSLTRITIPERVTNISYYVFDGCKKLQVIRLHSDDPAIFRNYGEVKHLGENIQTALESLRTGDYGCKCDINVKYPIHILHYLRTKDEKLGAYIRKNITKLMKAAITNGDMPLIQAVTQVDTFITKKSIDKFIQQALDEHQQRIWAYLADYKHRQFGFAPKDNGLL